MNESATDFSIVMNIPAGGIDEVAVRNRQLLIDAYRQIIDGKSDAIFELLAEDCEFYEAPSLPYGASKRGKQAVMAGVEDMFKAWSGLHIEIFDILTSGDRVIAYMSMKSVSRATGKTYDGFTAELFRFKDGLITEWRPIYWDTHLVRKVCGVE